MKFHTTKNVRVVMPLSALTTIFDECDRFDQDETGGRVVGIYQEKGSKLEIRVTGIIESGPAARRSAVSFFQDGPHQERIFRQIEATNPSIEHLGNWHTHHVNGLAHLSGGDISTYQRTVNHHNHNIPFFYALLVTAKNRSAEPWERYTVKHYIFRRNDARAYEIPARHVEIVEEALVWPLPASSLPAAAAGATYTANSESGSAPKMQRVYDRDILSEFYGDLKPFSSPKLGLYWRGPVELVDGSELEVVLMEAGGERPSYSVLLRGAPEPLKSVAEDLAKHDFPSARAALVNTERRCNRVLYELHGALRKP